LTDPPGHTRLPGYLRGRIGRIERVLGTMVFADARAAGDPTVKQTVYTVRFDAAGVWDADAQANGTICADLFESYLERVP
jgi:nitrile hydratase